MSRVLVVEDEILLLDVTVSALQDAGLEVAGVDEADAALERLRAETFDALVTDIRLPGPLTGWDIAAEARRLQPNIQVIYVTGFSPVESQRVVGSHLFNKPYDLDDLVQLLV